MDKLTIKEQRILNRIKKLNEQLKTETQALTNDGYNIKSVYNGSGDDELKITKRQG